MKKVTPKRAPDNYADCLWIFIKLLALCSLVYVFGRLGRNVPTQNSSLTQYSDICRAKPTGLFFENRPNDNMMEYKCWYEGNPSQYKFGILGKESNPSVKQKPSKAFEKIFLSENAKPLPAFWRHAQESIAKNKLSNYQNSPAYQHFQYELLKVLDTTLEIFNHKHIGLRCGTSRDLTIAHILATEFEHLQTVDALRRIPDFLFIDYNFDYDEHVDERREVVPDHGTLILLEPETTFQLGLYNFFNFLNNYELNNANVNVDAEIARVIQRLLNSQQGFQCDVWLDVAAVLTPSEGHCANRIFMTRPEKVERLSLLSVQKNPLALSLIQSFFTHHPEVKSWLLSTQHLSHKTPNKIKQ